MDGLAPYLEMLLWIAGGWTLSGLLFGVIFGRVTQRMMPWD